MKLDSAFRKLPLHFDAARLAKEVAQFSTADWRPHPQGYPGNSGLALIAVGGDVANDAVKGPMAATPLLQRCPYLCQVLASLQTVLGRTRLMRITGNGEATAHVDTNYYWMQRVRVHIPIVTVPQVRFLCGDRAAHMAAGECWVFDTWRIHNVLNPTPHDRIHLVADTVGSTSLWSLIAQGADPDAAASSQAAHFVPYRPGQAAPLELEQINFPVVMSPWEQEALLAGILADLRETGADVTPLRHLLASFLRDWRSLWARHGDHAADWEGYRRLLRDLEAAVVPVQGQWRLPNGSDAVEILRQALIRPALNPELAGSRGRGQEPGVRGQEAGSRGQESGGRKDRLPEVIAPNAELRMPPPRYDRPVIIVAAPRSGSTLLFETLSRSPGVCTIGGESHAVFEAIRALTPGHRDNESNRLTADDADPATIAAIHDAFFMRLRDRDGRLVPAHAANLRLLEKTPKNALRVPFLNAVFPDALFIYLYREPQENIGSILEAWRSRRFVTYPQLPDWSGPPWSLLLIPGWQGLRGRPLAEVAAAQWSAANQCLLDDLERLPAERWTALSYHEFLADPEREVRRLCAFAGIAWDQVLRGPLPLSRHTLTPPDPNKWRKHESELAPVLPAVQAVAQRARAVIQAKTGTVPVAPPVSVETVPASELEEAPPTFAAGAPAAAGADVLRSVHTTSLPRLLEHLGVSLLVTTYQAGKLVVVRAGDGALNTHFRSFPMPMGLAYANNRLALGTRVEVWDFRNQPAVAAKLAPLRKHDACFLPRAAHVTGDIRIHEIAWAGSELWVVNTRFSCLATLDEDHSFVPRWRPSFVTELAPEDRCHLNGLAVVDGTPRYATALGATDTAGGWRADKARGGVLLDVSTNESILTGLSMPHSPRWHQGRLWLLESGAGSLACVDRTGRRTETVALLPGFTRGLDFCGPYAFIGLSQVRESAVFSGIPLTDRAQERHCGVWVVDLRNGRTIAFLRFEDAVQEIFAVQLLPGLRWPEIAMDDQELIANSFVLPAAALAAVPHRSRTRDVNDA